VDEFEDQVLRGHEIQVDLDELDNNPLEPPMRRQNNWKLQFCPKKFWEQLEHRELASNVLQAKQKQVLGERVTALRKIIRARAAQYLLEHGQELDLEPTYLQQLIEKLRNRGTGKQHNPFALKPSDFKEQTAPGMRKRGRRREKVTLSEKIEMVHMVTIQQFPVKHVAAEYRVL